MMQARISTISAIIVATMVLGGCAGSKPPNYYILRSIQNQGPEGDTAGMEPDRAIGLGPVKIPQYLDRPEMASRTGQSGLQFAEFDKWAEPLDRNLTRVLADNLAALLSSERVLAYPWPDSMPVRYQVTVEFIHLEKMTDNKIILEASWNVLGNGGEKLLLMRRSKLIIPVESAGFEEIASAESRAVEALSRDIAAAVGSLLGRAS